MFCLVVLQAEIFFHDELKKGACNPAPENKWGLGFCEVFPRGGLDVGSEVHDDSNDDTGHCLLQCATFMHIGCNFHFHKTKCCQHVFAQKQTSLSRFD